MIMNYISYILDPKVPLYKILTEYDLIDMVEIGVIVMFLFFVGVLVAKQTLTGFRVWAYPIFYSIWQLCTVNTSFMADHISIISCVILIEFIFLFVSKDV